MQAYRNVSIGPGILHHEEVDHLQVEIESLSVSGWLAFLWPKLPVASEALDLLIICIAKEIRRKYLVSQICSTPDAWSRAASKLLERGRLPIPPEFGHEVTLRKLIRLLDPQNRAFVMGLADPNADLRAANNLGEWFSRAADAGCLILTQSITKTTTLNANVRPRATLPKFRSEVERLLFENLDRDDQLQGLFEPNVRIFTCFGTAPCVDFVWRAGKVIVEVDSFFYHGSPTAFSADRQRDYENLATGYRTLRLVDAEIHRDPQLAVAKIRRIVELKQNGRL